MSDSYEYYTNTDDRIIYLKGNKDYKILPMPQDTKRETQISLLMVSMSRFILAFKYQQLHANNNL